MFICLFSYVQDGKALPDGPVVISPDGLFPSLYREGNWWYMQFFYFLLGHFTGVAFIFNLC